MKSFFKLIFIPAILYSCNNQEPQSVHLFSINVPQGYFPSGTTTLIISNDQGQVIASKELTQGMQNDIMGIPEGPDINVTIIRPFELSQNSNIEFQFVESFLSVPVGETWTLRFTNFPGFAGSTNFSLKNIPEHDQIIITTAFQNLVESFNNELITGTNYSLQLLNNPQDIYIKIDPSESGPQQYRFINSNTFELKEIDLSQGFQNTSTHSMNIPSEFISFNVAHTLKSLDRTNRYNSFTLDWNPSGIPADNFVINYPPGYTDEYITEIRIQNSTNNFSQITETSYGPLPSGFTPIDAQINIETQQLNNFSATTSGNYDYYHATWDNLSGGQIPEKILIWDVYGTKNESISFVIPDISNCGSCILIMDPSNINLQQLTLHEFVLSSGEFTLFDFFNFTRVSQIELSSIQTHRTGWIFF